VRGKQLLSFVLLTKVRVFSYQNDFADYKGIDQPKAIIQIRIAEVVQQEYFVCLYGAKEKRQVQKDDNKLLKLMGGLLLRLVLESSPLIRFPF
jgi:hypothetical protein